MRFAAVLAVMAMLTTPAMAQEATENPRAQWMAQMSDALIAGGTWTFTAPRNAAKGEPICTESWTFHDDGTTTLISGSQTVEGRWEIIDLEYFTLLSVAYDSSSTGVDCMGKDANPADYPQPKRRHMDLLFSNEFTRAIVCRPALIEMPDGTKVAFNDDETCWGELRAAEPMADIVVPAIKIDPAALPKTVTTQHVMITD